jgi:hypothetical protein
MRKYLEKYKADTHQQRRQMLCRLSSGNLLSAAVWMHAHPGDLWNTVKERKRGWKRMFADDYAKDIALVYSITGFYDEPYADPDEPLRILPEPGLRLLDGCVHAKRCSLVQTGLATEGHEA